MQYFMEKIAVKHGKSYSIGRSHECNIVVDDRHISGIHCHIRSVCQAESRLSLCLTDYSSNGVWTQGRQSSTNETDPNAKEPGSVDASFFKMKSGVKLDLFEGDCFHLKSPKVFPNCSLGFAVSFEGGNILLEPILESFSTYDTLTGVLQVKLASTDLAFDLKPATDDQVEQDDCRPLSKKPKTVVPSTESLASDGVPDQHTVKDNSPQNEKFSGQGQESGEDNLELCSFCLQEFPISELVHHASTCTSKPDHANVVMEQCQFCWLLFSLGDLVSHNFVCPAKKEKNSQDFPVQSSQDAGGEGVERCLYCFKDFPISKLVMHAERCKGDMLGDQNPRFKDFLPSVHDLDAMSLCVLSPTQRTAVEYVVQKSQLASSTVMPKLLHKVYSMGYTDEDIRKTFYWIKYEAPIIIHLDLDRVLTFLVEDTHYRNLFETGTGSGSLDFGTRRAWEDRIFNGAYHDCAPHERVKYGVLNIVGDIKGVESCYCYGDSFLQLKKVRLRTTFASMDTAFDGVKLACCEHYANVLDQYSHSELSAIIDVATKRAPCAESTVISNYKEVQIHGPICLSENVDCIVVNERFQHDAHIKSLLNIFVKRNNCNLIWMDSDIS